MRQRGAPVQGQGVRISRVHRILIAVVVTGAMVIAAIGFAGSYAAVRELAERKGFGEFAPFFPIGVDAGIVVLLSLDLLLTWIRIPFPLLRQTAWLLTAATIAFNGAAAWPDPLGVGMHAVIPVLFVVTVEAARHAAGRVAAITADKHMEGVRLSRWLLAFPSTFRLWRRMKLWELRNYDEVIRMEQDRLVYETRLRAQYGRSWKRKAPVEALMPLKLTRYGVPLAKTAPTGLLAAELSTDSLALLTGAPEPSHLLQEEDPRFADLGAPWSRLGADGYTEEETLVAHYARRTVPAGDGSLPRPSPEPSADEGLPVPQAPAAAEPETPRSEPVPVPGNAGTPGAAQELQQPPGNDPYDRAPAQTPPDAQTGGTAAPSSDQDAVADEPRQEAEAEESKPSAHSVGEGNLTLVDRYYQAWADLTDLLGEEPSLPELADHLWSQGMTGRGGALISPSTLRRYRLSWRIYRVWAQHLETRGSEPSLSELEALCAKHGIRSKGGRGDRIGPDDLAGYLADFRRRYAAFARTLPH
ncbi:DUF2637 domain-containing protein [Streptomyces sp. CA-250714]|uniref:DUF2637 domain-containing protein n=1 Tax=Streptomyces sp. CA-250714 TaxID=3240060 RepID=UPI003D902CEB